MGGACCVSFVDPLELPSPEGGSISDGSCSTSPLCCAHVLPIDSNEPIRIVQARINVIIVLFLIETNCDKVV